MDADGLSGPFEPLVPIAGKAARGRKMEAEGLSGLLPPLCFLVFMVVALICCFSSFFNLIMNVNGG